MKKMIRCKVCGYIMEEGKLGEKCPACGVPKTAFAPFVDPVSAPRRRLLKFDLHPIAVHFPVSFTVAVLVFSIASAFLAGDAQTLLTNTTKIIALLLPIVIIIAGIAGYIDGKARFRKIGYSLILQRKILYSSFLFIVGVALAVLVWVSGLKTIVSISITALLSAIGLALVLALSLLGQSIREAVYPGS